jgi:hypothetical protein
LSAFNSSTLSNCQVVRELLVPGEPKGLASALFGEAIHALVDVEPRKSPQRLEIFGIETLGGLECFERFFPPLGAKQ